MPLSPPGICAIFPGFSGHVLAKLHRQPERKKITGEISIESNGDGSLQLQISVPRRGSMSLEKLQSKQNNQGHEQKKNKEQIVKT